jgi:hypothetical protein
LSLFFSGWINCLPTALVATWTSLLTMLQPGPTDRVVPSSNTSSMLQSPKHWLCFSSLRHGGPQVLFSSQHSLDLLYALNKSLCSPSHIVYLENGNTKRITYDVRIYCIPTGSHLFSGSLLIARTSYSLVVLRVLMCYRDEREMLRSRVGHLCFCEKSHYRRTREKDMGT